MARLNTEAILDASRLQFDAWQYFNHRRLFELAEHLKIPFRSLDYYRAAVASRIIYRAGALRPRKHLDYMYSDSDGMILYSYVRDVLHAVLAQLTVLNISDILDRGLLPVVVKPGDFILVQGAHNFLSKQKRRSGRNQG